MTLDLKRWTLIPSLPSWTRSSKPKTASLLMHLSNGRSMKLGTLRPTTLQTIASKAKQENKQMALELTPEETALIEKRRAKFKKRRVSRTNQLRNALLAAISIAREDDN